MRKTIAFGIVAVLVIGIGPGNAEAGKLMQGLSQRFRDAKQNVSAFLNRNKPQNLAPDRKWDGKAYQPAAKPQLQSGAAQVQYGQQLLGAAKTAGNARRGFLSGKIAGFFLNRQASNGSRQAQLLASVQERRSATAGSHPNALQRTGMRIAGGYHVANGTARVVVKQRADQIAGTAVAAYQGAVAWGGQQVDKARNSSAAAAVEVGAKRMGAAGRLAVGGLRNLGATLDGDVAQHGGYSPNVQQRRGSAAAPQARMLEVSFPAGTTWSSAAKILRQQQGMNMNGKQLKALMRQAGFGGNLGNGATAQFPRE